MAERVSLESKVGVGVFCAFACLGAAAIYFWGFGNEPLTRESWFWAAPVLSPVAYLIFLRWRLLGTVAMLLLYAAAYAGASQMIQLDCARLRCSTQNLAVNALAPMIAGFHLIFMLVALIWMCLDVWRACRVR